MTMTVPTRPSHDRLAASRQAAACGEEGLQTAFRRAIEAGLLEDDGSIEDYLDTMVDDETEDVLYEAGWRPCAWSRRCLRAGRCLRRRRRAPAAALTVR